MTCHLSASGFQQSTDAMLLNLLVGLWLLKTDLATIRYTLSNLSMSFWWKGSQTVDEYSKIDVRS